MNEEQKSPYGKGVLPYYIHDRETVKYTVEDASVIVGAAAYALAQAMIFVTIG